MESDSIPKSDSFTLFIGDAFDPDFGDASQQSISCQADTSHEQQYDTVIQEDARHEHDIETLPVNSHLTTNPDSSSEDTMCKKILQWENKTRDEFITHLIELCKEKEVTGQASLSNQNSALEALRNQLFVLAKNCQHFPYDSLAQLKRRINRGDAAAARLASDCYSLTKFLAGDTSKTLADIVVLKKTQRQLRPLPQTPTLQRDALDNYINETNPTSSLDQDISAEVKLVKGIAIALGKEVKYLKEQNTELLIKIDSERHEWNNKIVELNEKFNAMNDTHRMKEMEGNTSSDRYAISEVHLQQQITELNMKYAELEMKIPNEIWNTTETNSTATKEAESANKEIAKKVYDIEDKLEHLSLQVEQELDLANANTVMENITIVSDQLQNLTDSITENKTDLEKNTLTCEYLAGKYDEMLDSNHHVLESLNKGVVSMREDVANCLYENTENKHRIENISDERSMGVTTLRSQIKLIQNEIRIDDGKNSNTTLQSIHDDLKLNCEHTANLEKQMNVLGKAPKNSNAIDKTCETIANHVKDFLGSTFSNIRRSIGPDRVSPTESIPDSSELEVANDTQCKTLGDEQYIMHDTNKEKNMHVPHKDTSPIQTISVGIQTQNQNISIETEANQEIEHGGNPRREYNRPVACQDVNQQGYNGQQLKTNRLESINRKVNGPEPRHHETQVNDPYHEGNPSGNKQDRRNGADIYNRAHDSINHHNAGETPTSHSRVLMLGSSIFQGIYTKGLSRHVDIETNRGATLNYIKHRLYNNDITDYESIIIYAGGNDVANGRTLSEIRNTYLDIIEYADLYGTNVVICGLCPRRGVNVIPLNNTLSELCDQFGIEFVQNYDNFLYRNTQAQDRTMFVNDGIHLAQRGTSQLLRNIDEIIPILKYRKE